LFSTLRSVLFPATFFKEFFPCTWHIHVFTTLLFCCNAQSSEAPRSLLPLLISLSLHATGLIMRWLPGLMSVTTSKLLFSASFFICWDIRGGETLFLTANGCVVEGEKQTQIYCPAGNVSGRADSVQARCYLFPRVADVVLLRLTVLWSCKHLKCRDWRMCL